MSTSSITQDLCYAGTHILDDNDYSLLSLNQDVNNSLNLMPGTPSTLPSHDEPLSAQDETWPSLATFDNAFDDDNIRPLQRYDSDLNPEAKPFVSAVHAWPSTVYTTQQTQRLYPQRLAPLNTNVGFAQSPYSAPAVQDGGYAQHNAISPSLMVTDNDLSSISLCAQPQWSGHQQPIGQWLQASYHAGAQQDVANMDMELLTPVSAYASSHGRSRSSSIASAATYHCETAGCHKSFKSKTEYSHHLRNHGPRNHACPSCSAKFVFKKDMKRHMQIHSPENKSYFCTFNGCQWAEKGFQRKDHWKRHLRTHDPKQTGLNTPYTNSPSMSRSASYQ